VRDFNGTLEFLAERDGAHWLDLRRD
jgi:hypothetical protein